MTGESENIRRKHDSETAEALSLLAAAQARDVSDPKYQLDKSQSSESAQKANKNRKRALKNQRIKDDNGMRKHLAKWALIIISAQIAICDLSMIAYGFAELCLGKSLPSQIVIS